MAGTWTLSRIDFGGGFAAGSSGWQTQMETNLETLAWLTQLRIEALQNSPPGSPSIGDTYIVGAAPTGDWVGQANDLAVWWESLADSSPEWKFIDMGSAQAGINGWRVDSAAMYVWNGTAWVAV